MFFTKQKRMQLYRALRAYALARSQGATSRVALRGMRARSSYRNSGGAENQVNAAGLGFALLQHFVDEVQRLTCRSDSNMLMNRAR